MSVSHINSRRVAQVAPKVIRSQLTQIENSLADLTSEELRQVESNLRDVWHRVAAVSRTCRELQVNEDEDGEETLGAAKAA